MLTQPALRGMQQLRSSRSDSRCLLHATAAAVEYGQSHAKLKKTSLFTTGVIAALAAVLKLGRPESTFPVALRVMAWVPPLFDDGKRLSSTARRLLVKLATRTILALCPAAQPGSKATIPPTAAVLCQPEHLVMQ